jgi:predicted 2-oxoglutarate/Fe(II)-dependent dioxygenase YbiX
LFSRTTPEFEPARMLLTGVAAALAPGLLVPPSAQLAIYEDGAGYRAHRDNGPERGAPGENYRELTAILYLDERPTSGRGGALRCHLDRAVDVDPKPGRLVLFRSRGVLHEVVPVAGWTRVALTAWFLAAGPPPTRDAAALRRLLAAPSRHHVFQ